MAFSLDEWNGPPRRTALSGTKPAGRSLVVLHLGASNGPGPTVAPRHRGFVGFRRVRLIHLGGVIQRHETATRA